MDGRLLSRRSPGGKVAMAKIRTFARLKPAESLYDDYETTRNRLYLRIPDSYGRDSTLYNRTRVPIVNHEFKYSQVFNTQSTQEEVFNISAKNIIDGFLEGYNGTIFAYGQTSSGKTYTMQGELSNPEQRGLAPRSLSQIYAAVNARKEAGENITVHCSFLEIYQEVGYDLLKAVNKTGPGPTSFAKVTVVDGPQGAAVVKNLSVHAINTEEVAQAMLAQGELNRKVAETAMNNRSSRSHAVFTVYLSSRKGDVIVRSKMHFVDLAGSERVCKTGVKGLQLSEAKYINLSLHYLEGVIIALHQDATSLTRTQTAPSGMAKSWSASPMSKRPYSAAVSNDRPRHIPYRNSLLTMLLKDSLGGNCLTTMIATISLEMTNLSESISTCRFAQRVSCISNTARKNEEIDDKSMIKRLRTRVAELEAENSILKHGGQPESLDVEDLEKPSLTHEDRALCQNVVQDFLSGRLMDPIVAGVTDPFKFRECMSIFKKLIKEHSDKALRLTQKLKQQPSHIQEAYYTGGRYHEAPLAKPSRRQEITFRDDANILAKNAYRGKSSSTKPRVAIPFKPTILKSASQAGRESNRPSTPTEAWQLQLHDEKNRKSQTAKKKVRIEVAPPHMSRNQPSQSMRTQKPQSAGAALYRSQYPHEKKKAQEIDKLNKKVEAGYAQQMEETNHLKAFKQTVVEQEYEIALESLQRKLEVTRHQLADQHAYINKLKNKQSDPDLLEQEILVEKQLQRRATRISEELQNADVMLKRMKNSASNDNFGTPSLAYRSVHDKFAGMVKRDGSMNTYRVKSQLEQQQKIQNQIQKKIEQQRALVIEKSLEVKEMSTRQRLEEFKRKLAESQHGSSSAQTKQANKPTDTREVPKVQNPDPKTLEATSPSRRNNNPQTSKARGDDSVKESPKSSIFQQRIEHEKTKREGSIDRILSKYRDSAPEKEPADNVHARERSAQVDKILAKYKNDKIDRGQSKVFQVSSSSVKQNTVTKKTTHKQSGNGRKITGKSLSPNSEKDSGYGSSAASESKYRQRWTPSEVSRVQVPRSAMEYDAARLNSGDKRDRTRDTVKQDERHHQSVQSSKQADMVNQRDFDATLKSMLETRQGHHSRRTEAWAKNMQALKSGANNNQNDLLNAKLHQFMNNQYKKKMRSGHRSRERSRSQDRNSSNHRSKTAHTKKVSSAVPNNSSRRGEAKTAHGGRHHQPKGNREFSHRISHYQNTNTNSNAQTGDMNVHHQRMPTVQEKEQIATISPSQDNISTEKPASPKAFHCFGGLKKISRLNEHTSRIRETQNAAIKIQRAWRNYLRRTQKVRRY